MMRFVRYLYRSVNILNLLLLFVLAGFLLFVILPLFHAGIKVTLPIAKATTSAQEQAQPAEKSQPTPSPADYAMVGENNLFHPERRIPPEKKDEKALPKPELVLYGTIISDGLSLAYIEDKKSPKTTAGRGKRQTVIKKGDVLSGFVLKEIDMDKIVLTRGDETMVVRLTEKDKQREGDGTVKPGSGAKTLPTPPVTRSPIAKPPGVVPGIPPVQRPLPATTSNLPQRDGQPRSLAPRAVRGQNPGATIQP